jgi:hypothetical protein
MSLSTIKKIFREGNRLFSSIFIPNFLNKYLWNFFVAAKTLKFPVKIKKKKKNKSIRPIFWLCLLCKHPWKCLNKLFNIVFIHESKNKTIHIKCFYPAFPIVVYTLLWIIICLKTFWNETVNSFVLLLYEQELIILEC